MTLQNPGFENGWTTDPVTGNQTPTGWDLEWKQAGDPMWSAYAFPGEPDPLDVVLTVPECVHKSPAELPPNEWPDGPDALILEGIRCFKVFGVGFSATMRQTISGFEIGSRLTFRVPVQVHSHGDASWGACAFRVGVQGNFTPWATFTDGLTDHEWSYITASVVVTAVPVRVRIDLEGRAVAPVDFFIDALGLEIDAPEPTECYGLPREQYTRRYNVYPTWATAERREAIAEICAGLQQTCGPSYDDAGLGDLDDKTAVLWDIPAAQRAAFLDFFATYYPGTVVEFAGDSPEPPPPAVLWQRDPVWRDRHFGASTCALTIGQAGCYITGVAEAQRFYNIRTDATPVTVDETATAAGYTNCLLTWAAIENRLGMSITSSGDLNAHLDSGKVALLRVLPENPEHFVLAMRRAGSDYVIRNPYYGTEELLSARYTGVHSYRLLTPKTTPPPDPVSPRPVGSSDSTILLHEMQTAPAGIQNFLQTTHPPAHLVVGNGGAPQLVQARALWPTALLCYRRVEDGLDVYNPAQAAEYVQRYIIDLQGSFNLSDFSKPPIYLVSINEKYECRHATQNAACAAWDIAFMTAIEATGLNLKGIVYTAPVGNPEPDAQDLDPLLPMVAKAVAGEHILGKHCYYASVPADPTFYQSSGLWYQFRFKQDDDYFASKGFAPFWMLTEGGACQATVYPTAMAAMAAFEFAPERRAWPNTSASIERDANGTIVNIAPLKIDLGAFDFAPATATGETVSLNPGCGWVGCGSIQRYRDELLWCHAWYKNWNDTHGNRLLGVNLFTTGGWWPLFDLQGANLDVVTAALAAAL